jgi:hypothetical protein
MPNDSQILRNKVLDYIEKHSGKNNVQIKLFDKEILIQEDMPTKAAKDRLKEMLKEIPELIEDDGEINPHA